MMTNVMSLVTNCPSSDTHCSSSIPDFLKEHEIEQLYRNSGNPAQRFMIAVLFDAGARAEEFHNIRLEDVQLPEGKENFVKITLKEEYSKTKGRTISLYWKYSTEAARIISDNAFSKDLSPTNPFLICPIRRPASFFSGWDSACFSATPITTCSATVRRPTMQPA